MKNRFILGWILCLAIIELGAATSGAQGQASQPSVPESRLRPEEAAPLVISESRAAAADFTLTDLSGAPLTLSSSRGKVVLLDFWATWCPPCREEIPHFKELHAAYKGKGLQVIGISLDTAGPQVVRSYAQTNGILYPIAMGNSKVVQDYGGIRGIPTTFLIDKKGRIAKKFIGYNDKGAFEKEIQALLAE